MTRIKSEEVTKGFVSIISGSAPAFQYSSEAKKNAGVDRITRQHLFETVGLASKV
jgi:hypothetical protein